MEYSKRGAAWVARSHVTFALGALLAGAAGITGCADEDSPIDPAIAGDGGVSGDAGRGGAAPVDVRGTYVGNLVNRANTCPGDWRVGDTSQVSVEVTQTGDVVGAEVKGLSGLFLDVAVGARTLTGTAQGNQLTLTLRGTRDHSQGDCTYTWRADFSGRITGDTLEGDITYRPQTDGQAACVTMNVANCSRVQSFNGVRPATP
jgi:hypothetical protein